MTEQEKREQEERRTREDNETYKNENENVRRGKDDKDVYKNETNKERIAREEQERVSRRDGNLGDKHLHHESEQEKRIRLGTEPYREPKDHGAYDTRRTPDYTNDPKKYSNNPNDPNYGRNSNDPRYPNDPRHPNDPVIRNDSGNRGYITNSDGTIVYNNTNQPNVDVDGKVVDNKITRKQDK